MKQLEYEEIVREVLKDFIIKYRFVSAKRLEFGVVLRNSSVTVSATFRYREYQLIFENDQKQMSINDFVFEKYPNYGEMIKAEPEKALFQLIELPENSQEAEYAYCLITSFNFIEDNYPNAFWGAF